PSVSSRGQCAITPGTSRRCPAFSPTIPPDRPIWRRRRARARLGSLGYAEIHPESNPLRVLLPREQMIVAASWRPKNAEKFHAFGHLPHRADRRHPGGLVLPWLGVRRKPMASHQSSDGTHENGHHGSLSPE